jgi:TonB-dependent starch-binding outer membrane protein SusC
MNKLSTRWTVLRYCHALLLGCFLLTTAQAKTPIKSPISNLAVDVVKGKIIGEDGDPMAGVSIRLRDTGTGAISDGKGDYSITIPNNTKNPVLVFSMIGYETIEVAVRNNGIINVTLKTDAKILNEVVVVGYGTQQRKDVTGSISSIQMDNLKTIPATTIDQALQGRAAGVTVNNNSGQPGAGVSVRIRGITSVSSTNEPLYVIDGIPFSGDGGGDSGNSGSVNFATFGGGGGQTRQNALSALNPSDIVSIDILKDASATAIYGSRASNGVVIITTKRGKANESKITYDTYFGYQEVPRNLPMMELPDFAAYQTEIRKLYNQAVPEEYNDLSILGPGTNWQNEVFQKGNMQNHQLSISGGKDKMQFYVSGNYFKQNGIVIGSGFDRYSFRVNLDNQVRDWLKIGTSLTASRNSQQITLTDASDGVVGTALLQSPAIPARNIDGSYGAVNDPDGFGSFSINPVAHALLRDVDRVQNSVNGNLWFDVSLYKGLSFRGEFGGNMGFTRNSGFNPTFKYGRQENTVAKLFRTNEESRYWNAKQFLNYNKVFNNKHRMSAMIGHEAQSSWWESLSANGIGLTSNDVKSVNLGDPKLAAISDGTWDWGLESYLGRANYNFDDRLNFTFTYRIDGSSNFGPENRWGHFPSAAAAWTLNKEKFLKEVTAISNLKLRLGYGSVGNQQIGAYSYGSALHAVPNAFGTGFYPVRLSNPKLKWEASNQYNAGIDLGLFKNRYTLSIDAYKKVSSDFLLLASYPGLTGLGQYYYDIGSPYLNQGEMQNTGVDITINTTNIEKKNFKWNTSLVFSHYKNRLNSLISDNDVRDEELLDFSKTIITRSKPGQPIGQFYGFQVAGIFQNADEVRAVNEAALAASGGVKKYYQAQSTAAGDIKFIDQNGDGFIDDNDRVFIGSPHPDFTFGFTNTFNYKNFDLSIFLYGSQGSEIYNYSRSRTEGLSDLFPNQSKNVVNRWSIDNPSATMPRFALGDPNNNKRVSDRFIEDGSYIRIQNVSFGYIVPSSLLKKSFVKKVKVYGSAQNLYTFTKYQGFDPELGSYNQRASLTNLDDGHYPTPRTITLGINAEF